jgi:C2 domain
MLEQLTIREAAKTAGKDTGPLDSSCFQIIYAGEVITLRASNVSEKRQWINQVEAAKANLQKTLDTRGTFSATDKNPTADTIGTLNVQVFGPQKCFEQGKYRAIFVVGKIKGQILKSKIVDASLANPRINQSLIFTISSLDEKLQLTLYHYDKYSSDSNAVF